MKSTLSDIKQLFNIKKIAAAGLAPSAIPEGEFAIIDDSTNLTVLPATYADLPKNFRLYQKLNGRNYFSYDTIDKTCCRLDSVMSKPYKTPSAECWETTIDFCDCINIFQLNIGLDEASLMLRDGMTWAHRDTIVSVSPDELNCKCNCACTGTLKVFQNNVVTAVLAEKINALNSPFYSAEIVDVSTGLVVTDIDQFLADNLTANTDNDDTNDGPMLKLVLKGKIIPTGSYNANDQNYVYPRGVKLTPSILINGVTTVPFVKTCNLEFEIGAGYDLRAEEYENMNHYTNLNYYLTLSDGLPNSNISFQFENGVGYHTVTFEFDSKKSGLEDVYEGRYKRFAVILGTQDMTIFTALSTIFTQP